MVIHALALAVLSCACKPDFTVVAGWKKVRYSGKHTFIFWVGTPSKALQWEHYLHQAISRAISTAFFDEVLGSNWHKHFTDMMGQK